MIGILHPPDQHGPAWRCSKLWFTREFFERLYDGKVWTLNWPPEKCDGDKFSTPPRFGAHLCGCLLHYDTPTPEALASRGPDNRVQHHAVWRLGPLYLERDRILGVWPD